MPNAPAGATWQQGKDFMKAFGTETGLAAAGPLIAAGEAGQFLSGKKVPGVDEAKAAHDYAYSLNPGAALGGDIAGTGATLFAGPLARLLTGGRGLQMPNLFRLSQGAKTAAPAAAAPTTAAPAATAAATQTSPLGFWAMPGAAASTTTKAATKGLTRAQKAAQQAANRAAKAAGPAPAAAAAPAAATAPAASAAAPGSSLLRRLGQGAKNVGKGAAISGAAGAAQPVYNAEDLRDFLAKKLAQTGTSAVVGGVAGSPALMRTLGGGAAASITVPILEEAYRRFGWEGVVTALAALGGATGAHVGHYGTGAIRQAMRGAGKAGEALSTAGRPRGALGLGAALGKGSPEALDWLYRQGIIPKGEEFGGSNDETP
jgi:hypothetical protein